MKAPTARIQYTRNQAARLGNDLRTKVGEIEFYNLVGNFYEKRLARITKAEAKLFPAPSIPVIPGALYNKAMNKFGEQKTHNLIENYLTHLLQSQNSDFPVVVVGDDINKLASTVGFSRTQVIIENVVREELKKHEASGPTEHSALIMRYAEDCGNYKEPWKLWEYKDNDSSEWDYLTTHPRWQLNVKYRRKADTETH